MTPADRSLETVALTVGTAGHIDHGKTALVRLLTGCDTDTLPEEKARGMTIDLGYATCRLPNERRVGIVDVPGHERFIRNMVAGATAIDVVLLVVAADDGVMQQTIEHFHIVRLLGIKSGMVAVTKIDLAEEPRIEEVEQQVRALVAGSFLAEAPIVRISSKTGAGFDAFYDTFVAIVDRTARRNTEGPFCLHVERSFLLKGLGAIVSGIPRSGVVRVGDDLELLPAGGIKKVRGLQVFGEDAAAGSAGECVALRLSDLARDDVPRGTVLATPGRFTPARFVDARFHLLPGMVRPLAPRTAVRLHIGTSDAPGHLLLPELTPLAPGGEAYVQIQLARPVVAAPGDFFVVRQLSPVRTLGGGTVVRPDDTKLRRGRGQWTESVEEYEKAFRAPDSAIRYVLSRAGGEPMKGEELARAAMLSKDAARAHLAPLLADGTVTPLDGDRYVLSECVAAATDEISGVLSRLHDERPMTIGFAKKDVLRLLKTPRPVVEKALAELLRSGCVRSADGVLALPGRAPRLSPPQQVLADGIARVFHEAGFATPRRDELPAAIGAPAQVLEPLLGFLIETGTLVAISDKVILHRDRLAESGRIVREHFAGHATLEAGEFKDLLGATRKYAIPLLEYWDARGLTRRVGDARVLRSQEKSLSAS